MKKSRTYDNTFFPAEVIQEATRKLEAMAMPEEIKRNDRRSLSITVGDSKWLHDDVDEFFADYRKNPKYVSFTRHAGYNHSLEVTVYHGPRTEVSVEAPERGLIESVFEIFERAYPSAKLPDPPPEPEEKPVIFIGHGRSGQWRLLKDHLHDLHGYEVQAYETGARAGHTIRDILADLVRTSSFALLVMTAEDDHTDGTKHARENVIHEVGLFQGRLQHGRAIVLLENGATEFSNLAGIQQIRFSKDNIRETFGDVLATLKREFPS